jgi:hypothetical protein
LHFSAPNVDQVFAARLKSDMSETWDMKSQWFASSCSLSALARYASAAYREGEDSASRSYDCATSGNKSTHGEISENGDAFEGNWEFNSSKPTDYSHNEATSQAGAGRDSPKPNPTPTPPEDGDSVDALIANISRQVAEAERRFKYEVQSMIEEARRICASVSVSLARRPTEAGEGDWESKSSKSKDYSDGNDTHGVISEEGYAVENEMESKSSKPQDYSHGNDTHGVISEEGYAVENEMESKSSKPQDYSDGNDTDVMISEDGPTCE